MNILGCDLVGFMAILHFIVHLTNWFKSDWRSLKASGIFDFALNNTVSSAQSAISE